MGMGSNGRRSAWCQWRRSQALTLAVLIAGFPAHLGPAKWSSSSSSVSSQTPPAPLFAQGFDVGRLLAKQTEPGAPVRHHTTCAFIDGEIRHYNDPRRLPDSCFSGFNTTGCTAVEGYDRTPRCTKICSMKHTINGINGQKLRLLQQSTCEAPNQERLETSEFFLMSRSGLPTNVYGYEFRFRRKYFELDDIIVSCPLKRSGCDYAGDYLLGCTAALDDTYLAGYHLRLEVRERFRNREDFNAVDDDKVDNDDYTKRWWSVVSCEAEVFETTEEPEFIFESVKFWWTPVNYVFSAWQIFEWVALMWTAFFLGYVFYFAEQCIVCNNRSMFLDKNDLCVLCRCLGAELPHPEIVARLKREKASRHNHSLNRLSCKDFKTSVLRLVGIHQLPPMTCRTAALLCRDGCAHLWAEAKAACWCLVAVVTCGKVRRFNRPKVLTLVQAAQARHLAEEEAAAQAAIDAGPSEAPPTAEPAALAAPPAKGLLSGRSARVAPVEEALTVTEMA